MSLTAAGAWATPPDGMEETGSIDAPVPGTVAGALERAGRFDRTAPYPLNDKDAWYVLDLAGERPGAATLLFEGLASVAEIYWNGAPVAVSQSMFAPLEVSVTLSGRDRLAICFRALAPHLARKGPRARWRPQMITPQGLRLVRTSLLGYMPGWCPEIHPAGPFRPVRLKCDDGGRRQRDLRLSARLADDGTGHLDLSFIAPGLKEAVLRCAGRSLAMDRAPDGRFMGRLAIPDVEPWWPHTHGRPALHAVEIEADGERRSVARTGFRRISLDRGTDGSDFRLVVNGSPVFCRGAVWTNADIVDLPCERDRYEPFVRLAAQAGMNMLRIGGTMTYETADFFRLCDEHGILVWQDFMFANFDYPAQDPAFAAFVEREAEDFLTGVSASPSLAVLCGGSEIYQQAAMLGLPERSWAGPLTEEILPTVAARLRPDVPYAENSPSGGAMPFSPNAGVTHYYGVGAYCRPLEDARRAGIRFAAESLAFANVPEQSTLDAHLDVPAVHDPRWKARVPRDRGASWDFEDVRDHYLEELYGADPARLRRENLPHYLALSRAVSGEVMEATFAEWRRPGSSANGALVWTLQDLLPGAGWGVIDATGRPKPAWYALRRAFRPVQVLLCDEGTNGLDVHVLNETAEPLELVLELSCLREGRQRVAGGKRKMSLGARQAASFPATALFGAFFDTTYAFRFGQPAHDVTVAKLRCAGAGMVLAEAFHFPLGRAEALRPATVSATLVEDENGWFLSLEADRLAQSVAIEADGFLPSDNWFHLAPAEAKTVRLVPDADTVGRKPSGEVHGIGLATAATF